MIMNYHKDYSRFCIEFKSPTNNNQFSEAQKEMKKKFKTNYSYFMISDDYDLITKYLNTYMKGIRVPCKYCEKASYSNDTYKTRLKIIHRIEN